MSISLFDLEKSLAELMDIRDELLTEQPGLRPAEERDQALAVVEDALAEYVQREVVKVDGIHSYCRYGIQTAKVAREEAKLFAEKADRLENAVQRVKDFCMAAMVAMGKFKLEGSGGRVIARQKSGGVEALQVQDGIVPDALCDYTIKLDGESFARIRAFLTPGWRESLDKSVVKREPSNSRIREKLASSCFACGGAGILSGLRCEECGGKGGSRVPGAQLLERGETIRFR